MAQRYTHPVALERMAAGNCPECGETPGNHSASVQFWVRPAGCSLIPAGVRERIEQYQEDLTTRKENQP